MRAKLKLENMNGITVTEEIEDMILFTGSNGAGKSTRLTALLLALLGYVPDGPKRAKDIMAYATAKEMRVSLDGPMLAIERKFSGTRSAGKTSITVQPETDDFRNDKATDKEKNARILNEIGGEPFALDLGAFSAMNQNQQREYILKLCASEDHEDPLELIYCRLEENSMDPEQDPIHDIFRAQEIRGQSEEVLPIVLSNSLAILRSRKLKLEKDIRDLKETARHLAKEKRDINTSAESIRETKAAIAAVQKDLEDVAKEKGKTETAGTAQASLESQVKSLRRQLDDKASSLALHINSDLAAVAEWQEAARNRQGHLIKRLEELRQGIPQARERIDLLQEDLDKARQRETEERVRIRNAQARADLLQEGQCPIGFKCPFPPTDFRESQEASIRKIGYFSKGHKIAQETIGILSNQMAELRTIVADLEREERDLEHQRVNLASEVQTSMIEQATIAEMDSIREQIAELEKRGEAGEVITGDEVLDAKEQGLRARLHELNEALEDKEIQKANEISFARALEDRSTYERWLEVIKEALEILGPKGLQSEAAKKASGPFLDSVNEIMSHFDLKAYVETERKGTPIFEMGLEHNSHGRRPWAVLPKSFRAIMGCAIGLAVFQLTESKKSILVVDDLEHLDPRTRASFLEVISDQIKAGSLDLFVGAGSIEQPPEIDRLIVRPLDSNDIPEEKVEPAEEAAPGKTEGDDPAPGQADLFDRARRAQDELNGLMGKGRS